MPCDVSPNPQTTWVWFSEPLLAYTWHYFRIYILGVIFSVIEIHEGIIVVCVHSWAGGFPTERPPTKYKIHFKRFHHSKHKNICILIEQNLSIINIHHQIEAFITIWFLFFTKKILSFHSVDCSKSIFGIGFGRSELWPYEASGKFYSLRTHCALHHLIYYTMITSCKSLFTCRLLKTLLKMHLPWE